MPSCIVGSYRRRHTGDPAPKVTILVTFHKQITHNKAGYRTKRGLSQNYASLSTLEIGVNRVGSDMVISDLEWAFQVRVVPLVGLRCIHLSTRFAISGL